MRSVGAVERPVPAQRSPVLPAAGAGAGLLAGVAPGRARRPRRCGARSSWSRRSASTASASTRRSRIRASSYWCDRLGAAGLGRDGERLRVQHRAGASGSPASGWRCSTATRSHPCIVTWVPFNESWGVPNLESDPAQQRLRRAALYHLTRALDPTRPGDRQRRLGARRQRHPRHPRLQPRAASCCASGTAAARRSSARCARSSRTTARSSLPEACRTTGSR